MSDYPGSNPEKLTDLINFARRLIDGESGKLLISEYRSSVETVTAQETMEVLDFLLANGYSLKKVKSYVGKILNVFYKSLNGLKWNKPEEPHFLYYLMLENREVEKIISGIRPAIKSILGKGEENAEILKQLRNFIRRFKEYELHYLKKENILFPCLEKAYPQYRCLQLMWSFHDDFRRSLKSLDKILNEKIFDRHIRYFALRDATDNYAGTIEVSQDVTGIRNLKGEQRLLDWNL
jgi:hypothetical protein